MTAANDQLPETEFFKLERCPWLDSDGQKYFHIQPKWEKTRASKAMVGTMPGAHWNLESLRERLDQVNRQYAENRRALETRGMSDLGREAFDLGAMLMGGCV